MSAFRATLLAAAATSLLSAAAFADGSEAALPGHYRVDYDQSKVIQLDRPVKTVLVGNPAIADAMLISDKLVYVQGRMFGNTNLIALDGAGAEVLNTQVTVGAPTSSQVTLYRGANGQRNLACAPHCERTLTQGDVDHDVIVTQADKKTDHTGKSAEFSAGKK
jgi:Flp pilus assembly secretin CpaC